MRISLKCKCGATFEGDDEGVGDGGWALSNASNEWQRNHAECVKAASPAPVFLPGLSLAPTAAASPLPPGTIPLRAPHPAVVPASWPTTTCSVPNLQNDLEGRN